MEIAWDWIQNHANFLAWWYMIGLLLGLVWPIHYRESMKVNDWLTMLKSWPFIALFGPFAILNFPI